MYVHKADVSVRKDREIVSERDSVCVCVRERESVCVCGGDGGSWHQ